MFQEQDVTAIPSKPAFYRTNTVPTHRSNQSNRNVTTAISSGDTRQSVSSFSNTDLSNVLHSLYIYVRDVVRDSVPGQLNSTVHASPRGRTLAYRFIKGRSTINVEFQIHFCTSVDNLRDLKNGVSSFRIRATTISTHPSRGLKIDKPSSELHLFPGAHSLVIEEHAGFPQLADFVKTFFYESSWT